MFIVTLSYSYTDSCCSLSGIHRGCYSIRILCFASASNWITVTCVPDKPQQLAVQLICTTVASHSESEWWLSSSVQFVVDGACFVTVVPLVCCLLTVVLSHVIRSSSMSTQEIVSPSLLARTENLDTSKPSPSNFCLVWVTGQTTMTKKTKTLSPLTRNYARACPTRSLQN